MNRELTVPALVLSLVAGSKHALRADVKTDEKALVKFEGMLGSVVGIFGGKSARDGVRTSVAVRGDRTASLSDTRGNIVDLKEEKIGLMKRAAKPSNTPAAAPGHTTVMTLTNEVLNVGTTVVDADVSIPTGFKEVR